MERRTRVNGAAPRGRRWKSGSVSRGGIAASVLLALVPALAIVPSEAEAQLRGGVHAVHAGKAFAGSVGLGLRGGVQLPLFPFDVMLSGEHFFPDCGGSSGCGLQGLTADVNFRMVFPVVRPYASAGLAHRRLDPGGDLPRVSSSGPSVGAGVDVRLGGMGAFAELRYEFTDAPGTQSIVRAGVLLGLF